MAEPSGFWARRLTRNPDLVPRILSGCGIALIAAGPILLGGPLLIVFTAAATAVMAWEYRCLHTGSGPGADPTALLYAAAPALAVAALLAAPSWVAVAIVLIAAACFALWERWHQKAWWWSGPGLAVIGLAAVAFPVLRAMEPFGLLAALWIVAVVVATDIGAYAFGRALGGPKLWPRVSPKKTWAGLLGGMVCAAGAGALFAAATSGTSLPLVCLFSAIAALVAQAGDLAESSVKRHFDVKDASNLIPGHGGALDRLDGFMAVTLAAALSTWLLGRPVFMN